MKFQSLALLAFSRHGLAADPDPNFDAITKPTTGENVPAGSTYTIQWEVPSGAPTGQVTIELLGGQTNLTLSPVSTIASKSTWKTLPEIQTAVADP
jgi:hypothetical protein